MMRLDHDLIVAAMGGSKADSNYAFMTSDPAKGVRGAFQCRRNRKSRVRSCRADSEQRSNGLPAVTCLASRRHRGHVQSSGIRPGCGSACETMPAAAVNSRGLRVDNRPNPQPDSHGAEHHQNNDQKDNGTSDLP